MRIKFLSFIASFFMTTFLISSCLGNDDNKVEYSSNALITAFALDTAGYGAGYDFTIDQLKGLIYNVDSLPVHADTLIDKILIKTLTTASGVITMKNKAGEDSVINISDSIDLRNPIRVTVYAPDLQNKKTYTIEVRVHKHDPKALTWRYAGTLPDEITDAQKTVTMNDTHYTYSVVNGQLKVYRNSGFSSWSASGTAVSGLSVLPTSLLNADGTLLATNGDGKVYESTDGVTWQASSHFSGTIKTLISVLPTDAGTSIISYLRTDSGSNYIYTKSGLTGSETQGETSTYFPVENLSFTTYKIGSTYYNAVVGKHATDYELTVKGKTVSVAVIWGYNGSVWTPLTSRTSTTSYCPAFENPTIIYYNDGLYVWGDGFKSIYASYTQGVAWQAAYSGFAFPTQDWSVSGFTPSTSQPEFRGRTNYSVVLDTEKNNIYVLQSKGTNVTFTETVSGSDVTRGPYSHDAEVWRGQLNQYWFDQAN